MWCGGLWWYFLYNRYHDPVLGRFISVDPLIDKTRDAYGYGNNNPITYSDPTGLEAYEGPGGRCYDAQLCGSGGVVHEPRGCDSVVCLVGSPELVDTGPFVNPWDGSHSVERRTEVMPYLPISYEKDFEIFAGGDSDAARLMTTLQGDPNRFFPFTVQPDGCHFQDQCQARIEKGAVLSLVSREGSYSPGRVRVVDASDTSFTFEALSDHIGTGGQIQLAKSGSRPTQAAAKFTFR